MDGVLSDDAAGALIDTDPVKSIIVNFATLNRTVIRLPDGDTIMVPVYPAALNGVI